MDTVINFAILLFVPILAFTFGVPGNTLMSRFRLCLGLISYLGAFISVFSFAYLAFHSGVTLKLVSDTLLFLLWFFVMQGFFIGARIASFRKDKETKKVEDSQ